jgi:hypothetical protein
MLGSEGSTEEISIYWSSNYKKKLSEHPNSLISTTTNSKKQKEYNEWIELRSTIDWKSAEKDNIICCSRHCESKRCTIPCDFVVDLYKLKELQRSNMEGY